MAVLPVFPLSPPDGVWKAGMSEDTKELIFIVEADQEHKRLVAALLEGFVCALPPTEYLACLTNLTCTGYNHKRSRIARGRWDAGDRITQYDAERKSLPVWY